MRERSFQTAAARRRLDPIVWKIDGIEVRLRPSVDLAEIVPMVEALSVQTEGSQVAAATEKRKVLVATVKTFVDQASFPAFDRIADDLDVTMLSEMVQELVQEYAGSPNPTKQQLSSVQSEPTGDTSTDGVVPEMSTQSS